MSYQTQLQFLGIDATHKIVAIDVHPHLPWVVGANDAGVVRVWDYVTRKPVHKFSITDLDAKEKDAHALLATLEKDPNFRGPKVVTGPSQSKTSDQRKKLGNILVVKFVDRDVRLMKHELEVRYFWPFHVANSSIAISRFLDVFRRAYLLGFLFIFNKSICFTLCGFNFIQGAVVYIICNFGRFPCRIASR
jgi:hypothetical protein